MKVKPRIAGECTAVLLRADLLAEAGQYLVLTDTDEVLVMGAVEYSALFINDVPKRGGSGSRRKAPLADTSARVLGAFGPDTQGHFLENVPRKKIFEILSNMPHGTVSARLFELRSDGYIVSSKKDSPDGGRGFEMFSLTELGMKAVKDLKQ